MLELLFVPIISVISILEIGGVLHRIRYVNLTSACIGRRRCSILRTGIAERHARKAGATIERPISNAGYAVGDSYGGKATTLPECTCSNAHYAVGDIDTLKITTIRECPVTDAGYAIGNRHASQAVALGKCIIPNARYTVRYYRFRKVFAT